MRYLLVRDGIIENCILWDGEAPLSLGPDVQLVPEADLPGARIGDRVPEPEPEPAPESESPPESEPEPEPEPEPA